MPKTEIAKKQTSEVAVSVPRPEHLAKYEGKATGTEGLGRIVRPSFCKIVQKMSNDELTEKYGVGAIILTPDMVLLTTGREGAKPASFAPVLFYTEYCKWSANALKGQEPMIVERSFDPKSHVALKSQSSATWSEPHPQHVSDPKFNYRYCEHANFIIKLTDPEFMDTDPVLLSFYKTSYQAGQRLGKLCLARKAPVFAGQYVLSTRDKENSQGTFKVYTVDNHPDPWTDPFLCEELEKMHDDFYKLQSNRELDTQYDEEQFVEAAATEVGSGSY